MDLAFKLENSRQSNCVNTDQANKTNILLMNTKSKIFW